MSIRYPKQRKHKIIPRQDNRLEGWFKLARVGGLSDEHNRLSLNQPLLRSIVVPVDVDKAIAAILKSCLHANTLVWNRAVELAVNGMPRKAIIERAMAARKVDTGVVSAISSAIIYATAWCASMMRKAANPMLDISELEQLSINPRKRAFMLARQGCTIERDEIKFPGVGYLKIHNAKLFDRFYSLHGRWTALVARGSRFYVVIDAPSPLELLTHLRTDYDTRLQAVHNAYSHRTKKDPLYRRGATRMPLLSKFGKKTPDPAGAQDE